MKKKIDSNATTLTLHTFLLLTLLSHFGLLTGWFWFWFILISILAAVLETLNKGE